MKIKFTEDRVTRIAGLVRAGDVRDLPEPVAKQFINQQIAQPVSEAKTKPATTKED